MESKTKFYKWYDSKIEEAKQKGDEMFLAIPDSWYDKGLHCCQNGHVSSTYLIHSEKGCVCHVCYETSYIFPGNATHEELLNELNRKDGK